MNVRRSSDCPESLSWEKFEVASAYSFNFEHLRYKPEAEIEKEPASNKIAENSKYFNVEIELLIHISLVDFKCNLSLFNLCEDSNLSM